MFFSWVFALMLKGRIGKAMTAAFTLSMRRNGVNTLPASPGRKPA
jgi:hypothetical protein